MNKSYPIILSSTLGGLLLLGLVFWLNTPPPIARADPGDLFITFEGTGDCSQAAPCDLPTALGLAADGDTIYLAGGNYTGSGAAVVTLTHGITLAGGWDGAAGGPVARDPAAYPSILTGSHARRVVYVAGGVTATLDGLRIESGAPGSGSGGGVYAETTRLTIRNCWIRYNSAPQSGGGVLLSLGSSGAYVLENNRIQDNHADGVGGGVAILQSGDVALTNNLILTNTSDDKGGGVYVEGGAITLVGNTLRGNYADFGGGAVALTERADVTLVNNIVADNRGWNLANSTPGVFIDDATAHFYHTTLAHNYNGSGRGIHLVAGSQAWLTNTIVASHTVGIYAAAGATATLEATLWGGGAWANVADIGGSGHIDAFADSSGDPAFIAPAAGDYHVAAHSPAVDEGVAGAVVADIDGEPRPYCAGPDIGADESPCCAELDGTRYSHPQAAIAASAQPDDVVRVAGTCRGVSYSFAPDTYQAVYLTKTLTLRGGYTDAFTEPSDPAAHPTTLDALGLGRGVFVSGAVSPTLEALRITNGYSGIGGGVFVLGAQPTISACHIYNNSAGQYGGGLALDNAHAAIVAGNRIEYNTSGVEGGSGIDVFKSNAVALIGNLILSNTIDAGPHTGGGVYLFKSAAAVLINNVVAGNHYSGTASGGGIYLMDETARLLHNTLARNTGGPGLYVQDVASAWLTNTILVSHSVGIEAAGLVTASHTLWGNLTDTLAVDGGTVVTLTSYWGDPDFVDPAAGDYHIGPASAALDRATDAGVSADLDGDPRPQGSAPDLGADEWGGCAAPLSAVSIAGPASGQAGHILGFSAVITPAGATPPITYTWSPAPDAGAGTSVSYTFAAPGIYSLSLTATHCGGRVSDSHLVTVVVQLYLPLALRGYGP